uniref:vomeronasal type-1 receptor 94-like n=1 Tax=Jaculus jaculus TaxID=51337 RepID=UPI0003330F06|nr:vomeronasal type-1 receptor 94-like [Jaculus jaculus]
MNKINKYYSNTNIIITIYLEAGIGVLANTILLLFYILLRIQGHRPKLTDFPIALLAIVHLIRLVIMGLIATDIFLSWRGWDDITCKLIMFLFRFFRGLSLCATCLLSVLQAVTLSPRNSCLANFKHKSQQYIFFAFLLVTVLYTCIGSHLLVYVIATPNLTSHNFTYLTESCSLLPINYRDQHTFVILLTFRDVVLIGLMALSSVYMVTFLHRHKRQSQHLHSTILSSKASPEQRATQTILVLMSFFVMMSAFDSVISYLRTLTGDPIFHFILYLVAHSYATGSPLVILSTEKRFTNILRSMRLRIVSIRLFREG